MYRMYSSRLGDLSKFRYTVDLDKQINKKLIFIVYIFPTPMNVTTWTQSSAINR